MTQPRLPGAGVTTSGGRKGSARKFTRNRRDRRRGFEAEISKYLRQLRKAHGDSHVDDATAMQIEAEMGRLWRMWIPDHPRPKLTVTHF